MKLQINMVCDPEKYILMNKSWSRDRLRPGRYYSLLENYNKMAQDSLNSLADIKISGMYEGSQKVIQVVQNQYNRIQDIGLATDILAPFLANES